MNSTAVYDLIKARRDYLTAHEAEAKEDKYWQFTDRISHACLEHCMKVKGIVVTDEKEIRAIFSNSPRFWGGKAGDVDSTIGSCISSIWYIEQDWGCDQDCGDAEEDWYYVSGIYNELLEMLEYTEKTYGVFEIP